MTFPETWVSILTLIVGALLGGVFTYLVERLSRKEEREENEKEREIFIAKRSLSFLRFLKLEIEDIIVFFEVNKTKIDDIGLISYVKFNTSYWEILKSSGEVPILFDTTSLVTFTNFYYSIEKCNWLYEQFLDAENNGRANIEMIILKEYKKQIHSIQTAIDTTKIDLIIDQVIEVKSKEIELLEKSKKDKKLH